jgi:hypothetical protein
MSEKERVRMKGMKRIVLVATMVVGLGSVGSVFADSVLKTPAEILAGLTGKTIEAVNEERTIGKTYGALAQDAGKLDEFKDQMLQQKKLILDQYVKDGKLTQERADEIFNAIEENQTLCDGTGNGGIGRNLGACFGQGNGIGRGTGMMRGFGSFGRMGMGRGPNW